MQADRVHAPRVIGILITALAAVAMSWGIASALLPKAAADRTNSPPLNVTCNKSGCHTPPPGADQGSIEVTGVPACYQPGQKYTITVKVSDPTATRWGFEISAQYSEGNEFDNYSAGTLATIAGQRTALVPSADGLRQFISHDAESADGDGTYETQATSAQWNVEWTAPTTRTTQVCFYAAGIAANANGGRTGDRTYTKKICTQSCQPVPTRHHTWGEVKERFYR